MNNNHSDNSSRPMRPSVGLIHGAGLDLKHDPNPSDSRKEGMVMSLKLCDWGADISTAGCGNNSSDNNNGSGSIVLGCGMESGKVFIHDLRKMNSLHDDHIVLLNRHNTNSMMMEGRDRIDDANADHDDLLISLLWPLRCKQWW